MIANVYAIENDCHYRLSKVMTQSFIDVLMKYVGFLKYSHTQLLLALFKCITQP